MSKKVIIIGQGEQGVVIENIIKNSYIVAGFLDDQKKDEKTIGKIYDYKKFIDIDTYFFVALGDNFLRKKIFEKLKNDKAKFINAIHSSAVLEKNVKLGKNIFIGALTYVNINCYIGNNTYINNSCSIDHDNIIGKHCHLAPGVTTAGGVIIKDNSLIGMASSIMEDLIIEENNVIGAASNVLINIKSNSIYYGNPAKYIKENAN